MEGLGLLLFRALLLAHSDHHRVFIALLGKKSTTRAQLRAPCLYQSVDATERLRCGPHNAAVFHQDRLPAVHSDGHGDSPAGRKTHRSVRGKAWRHINHVHFNATTDEWNGSKVAELRADTLRFL